MVRYLSRLIIPEGFLGRRGFSGGSPGGEVARTSTLPMVTLTTGSEPAFDDLEESDEEEGDTGGTTRPEGTNSFSTPCNTPVEDLGMVGSGKTVVDSTPGSRSETGTVSGDVWTGNSGVLRMPLFAGEFTLVFVFS